MKAKKVVAWQVNEFCEGHSCVVFHHHGMAARRQGANELGEDFESVECFRAPHFDQFAEQGFVPVIEMIKSGWWFECVHCGQRISDSDDESEPPIEHVVTTKHTAFCNQSCFDAYQKKVSDHNAEFARLKQLVQTIRPDLHFVEFSGEWPQLSFLAKFKFEGCQYGGSVRKCHRKDDLEWFVANADKAAWDLLEATKQQGAAA